MKTHYFTLGQQHVHRFAGETLDKDVVLRITDKDPREKMFQLLGKVWSHEYESLDKVGMEHSPRGIFDINDGEFVEVNDGSN